MLSYKVHIFVATYRPQNWRQIGKTHQRSFHVFPFDGTEEKVAVRFKDEKDQDTIYEITLCQYLDPGNELSIDRSISFLCVAHPV